MLCPGGPVLQQFPPRTCLMWESEGSTRVLKIGERSRDPPRCLGAEILSRGLICLGFVSALDAEKATAVLHSYILDLLEDLN